MYTRSLEIRHKGNWIERLTKAPLYNHQEPNQSTQSNMDSHVKSQREHEKEFVRVCSDYSSLTKTLKC